jgi:hypothetical protein
MLDRQFDLVPQGVWWFDDGKQLAGGGSDCFQVCQQSTANVATAKMRIVADIPA